MKIFASIFTGLILVIALIGGTNLYFLLSILFYKPDPAQEAARLKALSAPCMAEPNLQLMLFGEKMTVSRKLIRVVLLDEKNDYRGLSPNRECIEKNVSIWGLNFIQELFKEKLALYVEGQKNYPYHPRTLLIRSRSALDIPQAVKEFPFWRDLNQDFSLLEGKILRPSRVNKLFRTTIFIKSKSYTFPDGQPFIWRCPFFNEKK